MPYHNALVMLAVLEQHTEAPVLARERRPARGGASTEIADTLGFDVPSDRAALETTQVLDVLAVRVEDELGLGSLRSHIVVNHRDIGIGTSTCLEPGCATETSLPIVAAGCWGAPTFPAR